MKIGVELKLFERKLELWELFENWNFESYLKMGVLEIKFENWNFGKFENGCLKKLEFWRIIWEWDFLKIKFENCLKIEVFKN